MTSEELRAAQEYTQQWGCFPNQIWEQVTAEEAILLAQRGIVPCGFIPQEPMWADPSQGGDAGGGGGYSIEPINEPQPVFSAANPISVDVVDSAPPEDQLDEHTLPKEPTVFEDLQSGPGVSTNIWSVIAGAIPAITGLFQDGPIERNNLPMATPPGTDPIYPAGAQVPTFSTGIVGGPMCWDNSDNPNIQRRRLLRRTVRMKRFPDGSIRVVQGCRPRRMNPLNARALGRAARRLSSFHRISKHIEKVVQRACKGTASRRAPRMYGGSRSCRTKWC